MARRANNIVPIQQVENLIYLLRGQKAMLDSDLAALYGVPTKVLNQAVRRNLDRFPEDFMFQLSVEELQQMMRSQIVTTSDQKLKNRPKSSVIQPGMWSQIVTTSNKRRRRTHSPYVFTEQGIAMLSSVLRSPRAVQVNIEIMRAFVKIRQWLASNADLSSRLDQMEKKFDHRFKIVFDAIREMNKPDIAPRREIGFHVPVVPKAKRKNPARQK